MLVRYVVAIPRRQAFLAQLAQVVHVVLSGRRSEDREMPRGEVQVDVDAVGDFLRTVDGVCLVGKRGVHLLRAAQIELIAFHAHALLVGEGRTSIHAEQNVVRVGVILVEVMGIVGGDQRQTHLLGQIDDPLGTDSLVLQTGILDLQIVPVAEHLRVPGDHLFGVIQPLA